MRNRSHIRLVLLVSVGLSAGLRGDARAQDFAAAGRHFAAAQDAFAKAHYALAAKEFQAAYDITKDPVLLFNLGESYQRAGQAAKAIESYRAYLRDQPGASDRAEVERRLKALATADPAAAEAAPEDKPAPEAAPPSKAEAPLPALPEKEAERPSPRRLETGAWTMVATTVALLTAGAIMGLGAQNRADELERRTSQVMGGQPPIYDEAQHEAYTTLSNDGRAYNFAAIGCFAAAGASAIISAILFAVDYRRRPKERLSLSPRSSPSALSWSF